MSQVLKSLDAVTSDADGDVLAFNSPQTKYAMHYIAIFEGGPPALFIRARAAGLAAGRTVTAFVAVAD
jgi:hypothetical protein